MNRLTAGEFCNMLSNAKSWGLRWDEEGITLIVSGGPDRGMYLSPDPIDFRSEEWTVFMKELDGILTQKGWYGGNPTDASSGESLERAVERQNTQR